MHIGYCKIFSLLMIPVLPLCLPSMLKTSTIECSTYMEQTENILVDTYSEKAEDRKIQITGEEALDLVKMRVADNFVKVYYENEIQKEQDVSYYYQLPGHAFYLVCEEIEGNQYFIRLYEFVIDDEENQIGHTYTYGWYTVDRKTSKILDACKE